MGRLDDKVALVTGGANGIGRACCVRFAEEGADVVVADILEAAGHETLDAVEAEGRRAVFAETDVTSRDANEAAAQRAVDEFGGLDIVVTAAGISHAGYRSGDPSVGRYQLEAGVSVFADPARAFVNHPSDDWDRVLAVNLTGTLLTVQAAAGRMLDRGTAGSIITIASIGAKHPEAGTPSYSVSKSGVWMLTKYAARSLAPAGIRVNSIGPGLIETNMTAILNEMPEARDHLMRGVPMGRLGQPREVANTALFLASDESSYFTGEILHPDGGFYTE